MVMEAIFTKLQVKALGVHKFHTVSMDQEVKKGLESLKSFKKAING
jgi:hypothetical protein